MEYTILNSNKTISCPGNKLDSSHVGNIYGGLYNTNKKVLAEGVLTNSNLLSIESEYNWCKPSLGNIIDDSYIPIIISLDENNTSTNRLSTIKLKYNNVYTNYNLVIDQIINDTTFSINLLLNCTNINNSYLHFIMFTRYNPNITSSSLNDNSMFESAYGNLEFTPCIMIISNPLYVSFTFDYYDSNTHLTYLNNESSNGNQTNEYNIGIAKDLPNKITGPYLHNKTNFWCNSDIMENMYLEPIHILCITVKENEVLYNMERQFTINNGNSNRTLSLLCRFAS